MDYILSKSLSRADIVITCGGIGPTKDDITRDIVAKVTGKKLVPDQDSLDHINNRFRKRGMIPTKNNDRQAYFPENSIIVKNPNGTAPSFIVEKDNKCIISLPGVPFEMKWLIDNEIIPFLVCKYKLEEIIHYKVLKTIDLGESIVDDLIGNIIDELDRLKLRENTIIIFQSDNGHSTETRAYHGGGFTGPYRGAKQSLFEGGIREPGIMHWPGKIQTGVVSSEPCASMDIAPTILDAAGVNLSDHYLDGKSLIKLANGKDSNSDRVIFWEYLDQTAVRKGKWKLVLKGKLIEAYGPVPVSYTHLRAHET